MTANKNGDDFSKLANGRWEIQADKMIIYDDDNHPMHTFTVTDKPDKTPVAHVNKNTYEDLVKSLSELMGRDAKLSTHCTEIECPNAFLCLTARMVPFKCHTCGKQLMYDPGANPLHTVEEFEVPKECKGYRFDTMQACTTCSVQQNVHRALESMKVPAPPPADIKYDSNTGIVHVPVPIALDKINVKISLGD